MYSGLSFSVLMVTVKSFYVNKNAKFDEDAQNEIANRRQTPKNFHCKLLEGLFVQTLLKKKDFRIPRKFPKADGHNSLRSVPIKTSIKYVD